MRKNDKMLSQIFILQQIYKWLFPREVPTLTEMNILHLWNKFDCIVAYVITKKISKNKSFLSH